MGKFRDWLKGNRPRAAAAEEKDAAAEQRGRPPMTKAEREEILGIGPHGYCEPSGDFSQTDLKTVPLSDD